MSDLFSSRKGIFCLSVIFHDDFLNWNLCFFSADKYWLLDEKTMLELSIFNKTNKNITVDNNLVNVDTNAIDVDNNLVNADNNRVNVYKSTQKEKEKKKKEKMKKKIKGRTASLNYILLPIL